MWKRILNTDLKIHLAISLLLGICVTVFIFVYDFVEFSFLNIMPGYTFALALMNSIVGGVVAILTCLAILTAVAKLKKREEIEESEKKFHSVSSASQDAIVMLDSHTHILFWNDNSKKMFGYSEEEVLGKSLGSVIEHTPVFQKPKGNSGSGFLGRQDLDKKTIEFIANTKEGNEIPIELSLSGVKSDGEWNTIGIIRDISDRKRAEVKLEAAYSRIKKAQVKLAKVGTSEAVGKMASGVVHDVKNPLTIILQGAEYLSETIKTDDESVASTLNYITDAVSRADNVVRGLLDVANLSKLNLSSQSLEGIIENALSAIKFQLDQKKVKVSKEFEKDLPRVMIDPQKIEQAVTNLLVNALHAMPDGGEIRIRMSQEKLSELPWDIKRKLNEDFEDSDIFQVCQVEDSGTGIPEDMLDKVLEPFFTTKQSQGGTGLGLSSVKNIIELHGGVIDIRNRADGLGAIATVVLAAQ